MTHQEDAPQQIYIPALRRELVPYALPDTVLFMDPGLPQTAAAPGFFHPRTHPFSRERAAAVLAELLAVGETLDAANAVSYQAAHMSGTNGAAEYGERAALARFAAGGPQRPLPPDDPKIAAQKILLLAWDLETRLLEIVSLHKEVAEALKPLAENLHGDGDTAVRDLGAAPSGVLFDTIEALPASLEPDWRLSLMAIAAFAPEGTLLVTCHGGIRNALLEAGMLTPLPGDRDRRLSGWPENPQKRPLWTKTPLWRLLGHSREPGNAPWLAAAPDIIVWPE